MDSQLATKSADTGRQATDREAGGLAPLLAAGGDARLEGNPGLERLERLSAILNGGPRATQLKQREALVQSLGDRAVDRAPAPIQGRAGGSGLPDPLKSGVEALSGIAMDDVRVHHRSPEPAGLGALAFTQGTDIHVGPGQERHLPHEAWHVVQQAQGRVRPTMQMKGGVPLNDDAGLEREADVMGARALSGTTQQQAGAPARARRGREPVVQAIMSLAAFQALSPGGAFSPRRQILTIDGALTPYIASGANKGADAATLEQAIRDYLALDGRSTSRRAAANALLAEIVAEGPLATALGANGGLLDDLVRRAGGDQHIVALTALATAITPAQAGVLPQLITLANADLAALQAIVQHVLPANAHHLAGLIPLAGGYGQIGALDTLIQNITAANVLQLYPLIPLANGDIAGLATLVQSAGAAHAHLLTTMIPNAGGAGEMARLAAAINLNHAGVGNLAQDLTTVAAGVAARFQELTTALPNFLGQPPLAVPANVTIAVAAYNAVGAPPFAPQIPNALRIGQVNFQHFLSRHVMEFFDFGNIGPTNDQWPLAVNAAQVANLVIAGLAARRGLAPAPLWFIRPQNPVPVPVDVYTARMGVIVGGPQLPHPTDNTQPPTNSVILGQFFPVNGPGIIRLNAAAMNAINQLR